MEVLLSALANPKLCHERARSRRARSRRARCRHLEVSTTRVHGSTELSHSSIYSRVPSGHRVPAAAAPGCKTARRAQGCLAEDLGCQRRPAAREPRARFSVRGDLAPRPCGRGMNCGTRQQKLHSWTTLCAGGGEQEAAASRAGAVRLPPHAHIRARGPGGAQCCRRRGCSASRGK